MLVKGARDKEQNQIFGCIGQEKACDCEFILIDRCRGARPEHVLVYVERGGITGIFISFNSNNNMHTQMLFSRLRVNESDHAFATRHITKSYVSQCNSEALAHERILLGRTCGLWVELIRALSINRQHFAERK